jgi:hypothetical protein
MRLPEEDVLVPKPPEQNALDEIAVVQDEEHEYLDLAERLGRIRDHVYVVIVTTRFFVRFIVIFI